MPAPAQPGAPPDLSPPRAAALAVAPRHAVWLDEDGAATRLSLEAAARRVTEAARPPYVCHARAVAGRLGLRDFAALDLLELFAFARPARLALPTARGLARALGLPLPGGTEAEAATLPAGATLTVRLSRPSSVSVPR